MTFRHNIAYMINSFVVSLDIPVMIKMLYEIIEILHEKILNAVYLYSLRKDTSEKNNSQNDLSAEP